MAADASQPRPAAVAFERPPSTVRSLHPAATAAPNSKQRLESPMIWRLLIARWRPAMVVALGAVMVVQAGYAPPSARAVEPSSPPPTPMASNPVEPVAEPVAEPDEKQPDEKQPDEKQPDEKQPDRTELVARRTETSRTYLAADGTLTTELFPEAIHFRPAPDEPWNPIDLTFRPVDGDDKAARLTDSPVVVQAAPGDDPRGFLSVTLEGHQVSLRPVTASRDALAEAEPTLDASTARITEALPGVDLIASATPSGVNSFFIWEAPPAEPSITFLVDAPDLKLAPDDRGGAIGVVDDGGNRIGSFLAPYAVDSTPDELTGGGRITSDVAYALSMIDGMPALTVTVDPDWLAGAVYPVYVDPTIFNNGSNTYGDAHVNQGNPNFNYANYKRPDSPGYYEMWLGESPSNSNYYNEAYIKFDLSTIAGTSIDSATLEVHPYHQYYNAPTATTTWLRRVLNAGTWTESTIKWSNKPGVASTGVVTAACVEGQQCAFAVTGLVQGWLDGTYTNNGVRLDENGNGPTYWKRLIASEQQLPGRPRLLITNHVPVATPTTPTGWRNSRTLAWTYSDAGGHAQSNYEFDVDNNSDFSSLVYNGPSTASAATSASIPGTVTLTSGTTYYWRVRVRDGTSWSAWASSSFQWDATAPSATIAVNNGSAYATATGVTLNVTRSDAHSGIATTQASNNNSTYTAVSGTSPAWTLTSANGSKTVWYRVTDAAGNATTVSDTIVLDTADPSATISVNNGAAWTTLTGVTLNVSASDATSGVASTQASNDNTTYTSVSGTTPPWTLTGANGTKTVWYRVTDAAGRQRTVSDTIGLDTGDPTAMIAINNGAATTSSTTVTLNVTASDATSGVATTQASNDNVTYTSVSGTSPVWTLTAGDGTKTVWYRVTDVAGRATTVTDTIVLSTDVAPPDAPSTPDLEIASDTGLTANDDVTMDPTPTFIGTAENGATVILYADTTEVGQGIATGGEWSITASALADGVHAMTATATDASDNTSLPSAALAVTIDTEAPAPPPVTDDAPAGSDRTADTILFRPVAAGTITLQSTGTDTGSGIASSTFGSLSAPTGWTYTPATVGGDPAVRDLTWSAAAGAATLAVTVTDVAGNSSSATTISFVPDATAPGVTFSTPGGAPGTVTSQTDTTYEIAWVEIEEGSGVATRSLQRFAAAAAAAAECAAATYIEDGAAVSGPSPVEQDDLIGGTCYQWRQTLIDDVGNGATVTSANVFVISLAPPAPSIPDLDPASDTGPLAVTSTSPLTFGVPAAFAADDITSDVTPSFSGTNDPAATQVALLVDGVAVGTDDSVSSGEWMITSDALNEGSRTVTARAIGPGGTSVVSGGLVVTIDTTHTAAPGTPDLAPSGDNGTFDTDNITTIRSPLADNVSAPIYTGHFTAERSALSPTISASATVTPALTWSLYYENYSGRVSTGLMCNTGDYVAGDYISSGQTWTKAWPASATWCYIYSWIGGFGAGPYDVTGGSYSYHDPTVIEAVHVTGSVASDAATVVLHDDATPIGAATAAAGSYAVGAKATLDLGLRDVSVIAYDLAGNASEPSGSLSIEIVEHLVAMSVSAPATSAVGATTFVPVVMVTETGAPFDALAGRTVAISSDDPGAIFPGGATTVLTAGDRELGHTFRVLFSSPGTHQVTVSSPGVVAAVKEIDVAAGALRLAAPETVHAGVPFKLAVIPRVSSKTTGAINRAYGATVTLSSTDPDPDFGAEVNGANQFTFSCNCEGAHAFATTLTETGPQSITVTDAFGVTDTISVDVVSAPGGAASTITRVDIVQWPQGNTIDYYITASGPYQLTSVSDTCGLSDRALSRSSGGIGAGTTGGAGIARAMADPTSPIHAGVLPAADLLVSSTYVEGTLRLRSETGACNAAFLGEGVNNRFWYTDSIGREGVVTATKYRTFAEITNSGSFVQQGPDSPIASWTTLARGGTVSSTFTDPTTGGQVQYAPDAVQMRFTTRSAIDVYRVEILDNSTAAYNLGLTQFRAIPAGTSDVVFHDVPYVFQGGCAGHQSTPATRITYSGSDGRTGMLSGIGLWGTTTFPAPPGGWPCLQGTQSQPQPPEPNDPLRDALDRLGLDDMLGVVDAVSSLSHMTMGDPVDVATGAQLGEATDFALGGATPALTLTRRYRSDVAEAVANGGTPAARADGLLGIGWATDFDWKLDLDPGGSQVIVRGEAAGAVAYSLLDDDSWRGPGWFRMTLIEDGTDWLLTRPTGDGYRFDEDGRLDAVLDQQGDALTLDWDGSGHLESVTDASGRTAVVTTDGDGHITRIDLPDGRYVAYTYDTDGFLATVRGLDGEVMTYVTDARGRITAIRDPLDRTVLTNVYDGRGRVVRQTDALGNATRFAYDRPNLVTLTFGPRGDVTMTCLNPDGTTRATLDAEGGLREYTYDHDGRTLAVTDELGRRTRYRYDADGNPTHVIDPLGQQVVTEYDEEGRPVEMTGLDGAVVTTTYDAPTGGPETVTRTLGGDELEVATYTYTADGLPETIAEPGGATTTLGYDADGYLASSTDAEGRETTFTTDARGYVTVEVGPLGNAAGGVPADHTTTRTYDDAGRLLTETEPTDATWTSTYDEMGRLLTRESPAGTLVTNVYDAKGQLTSSSRTLTGALDATTTYEYDTAGNLTAIEDPEERRTEFEYDLLNRRVLVRDAEDNEWLTSYDAAGQVIAETDPTGRTVETAYDAASRVVAVADAANETTTYAYDVSGRLETVTDPLAHTTTYGYDWMGRQESVTNALDDTASVVFDDAGDVVSVTNARGKTTTFAYDATHRLTVVTEPGGIETTFTYDDAGRLESRTNERGAVETYGYDALGRPTLLTDPADIDWITTYDANGRVATTVDGEGRQVVHAYDLGGRLASLTPDTGPAVTFTYDDGDRLLTMTDGAGTTTYGYDAVGRLTSSTRAGRTVTYGWDPAGRPDSVTYPASAGTVSYAYDTAGRLAEISDWADRLTTFEYDAASRVTDIARPGELTTEITYDALDRPTLVEHAIDGTPTLAQGYGYDENGNLASYTDDAGSATFTYDDLDRLTNAVFPGSQTYTYGYDAVGNLTSTTTPGSGTTTLAYDLSDRITTSGYASDDSGALTADPTRTYAYDGFGRLAAVTLGATTTTYTLDGAGRRLAETTGAVTTSFDLDLSVPNATILGDGTRTYLPGDPSAGYAQAGIWHSALSDQLGSPHSTVSHSGVQSAITRWDPFGSPRPGSSVSPGIGYAGEWRDPTGLIDLRARAYDPSLGRFTSRDGFGGLLPVPQTANRYSYALNGPYRYTDPSGRFVNAVSANAPLLTSLAIQSVPGVGDAYGALTGFIGHDPIAGISLSSEERAIALGGAAILGGGFHLLSRLGNGVADASRLGRAGDGPGARDDAVVTAFRVEGPGNERILIGAGGSVDLVGNQERTLFLNFGQERRARAFLERRQRQGHTNDVIKAFDMRLDALESIRAAAVPERLARAFPDAPIRVDTATPDQFGLRLPQIRDLPRGIVPGSGRQL